MPLETLPSELLTQIFSDCTTLSDAHRLSLASRRLHAILTSSAKLTILRSVAETQFGPLEDAIQLLTHNASQPAHTMHDPAFSLSLLGQMVHVGVVATKWAEIYPPRKWRDDFPDRRVLTTAEARAVRRAVYRLWLFGRAFHHRGCEREMRRVPGVVGERARLVRRWATAELAEMADVFGVMRGLVWERVCPSDGAVAGFGRAREGHHQQHLREEWSPVLRFDKFGCGGGVRQLHHSSVFHDPAAEGWGGEIDHYYVIEDMMKLDPEQIVWLVENAGVKGMVKRFVDGLGDWFENNGETWGETLEVVLAERGRMSGGSRAIWRRLGLGLFVRLSDFCGLFWIFRMPTLDQGVASYCVIMLSFYIPVIWKLSSSHITLVD